MEANIGNILLHSIIGTIYFMGNQGDNQGHYSRISQEKVENSFQCISTFICGYRRLCIFILCEEGNVVFGGVQL